MKNTLVFIQPSLILRLLASKKEGTLDPVYPGKRNVTTAEGTPATDVPSLLMQDSFLNGKLKAGTDYSSSQSAGEPCQREGIPREELCPFYALHNAGHLGHCFFPQFCTVITSILWFTFYKMHLQSFLCKNNEFFSKRYFCHEGNRYCSKDYWYIFPVL